MMAEDQDKVERKAERKAQRKAQRKAERKAQRGVEKAKPAAAKAVASPRQTPRRSPRLEAQAAALAAVPTLALEATADAPVFSRFSDAPFAKPLLAELAAAGFSAPTPIQARAWPLCLSGSDLIAIAKTGSGKTLAFALPMLHQLAAGKDAPMAPRGLVLSPTRELALQIHAEVARFGKPLGLGAAVVYGGAPSGPQKKALREAPAVLVAT